MVRLRLLCCAWFDLERNLRYEASRSLCSQTLSLLANSCRVGACPSHAHTKGNVNKNIYVAIFISPLLCFSLVSSRFPHMECLPHPKGRGAHLCVVTRYVLLQQERIGCFFILQPFFDALKEDSLTFLLRTSVASWSERVVMRISMIEFRRSSSGRPSPDPSSFAADLHLSYDAWQMDDVKEMKDASACKRRWANWSRRMALTFSRHVRSMAPTRAHLFACFAAAINAVREGVPASDGDGRANPVLATMCIAFLYRTASAWR